MLRQNNGVIPTRHEADVLTLRLLRYHSQAESTRPRPRLRLRQRTNRQQHPTYHRAIDSPQEVALILRGVQSPVQLSTMRSSIVPRRNPLRVERVRLPQQIAKLRERVPSHTRNRRASPRVLAHEVLQHVAAERILHVQHVVRNAELLAYATRVVDRVEGAARAIGHLVAVAEELHCRADHIVPVSYTHLRAHETD